MAILLILPGKDAGDAAAVLRAREPELDVRVWPDCGKAVDIELALVWNHPPGVLSRFPNLKAVISYGAGVDRLFRDPELPDVPLGRFVDPGMAREMAGYALAAALSHRRRFADYRAQQAEGRWRPLPVRGGAAGVMGLGRMGGAVARQLAEAGFAVRGWSRSPKTLRQVVCFHGEEGLPAFVNGLDCLICALPLTPATAGILNRGLFDRLNPGSLLINIARGKHLAEADLLAGLAADRPGSAVLDVFREEPLPADHPFWNHPRVAVTPHVAGLTDPRAAAAAVAEEYARLRRGLPPQHPVHRDRGY